MSLMIGILEQISAASGGEGGGFPSLISVGFNEDASAPYLANIPAVLEDDLVIILTTFGSSGTLGSTPSGWAQFASTEHGIYKWITADAAATTVDMNVSGGGADPGFTVVLVRDADTAQNPQATVLTGSSGTSAATPALDPTWPDSNNRFILYCGTSSSASTITVAPSGYTLTEANAGSATTSGIATKTSTSSASEDPANFTLTIGASLVRTFTIAVKGI